MPAPRVILGGMTLAEPGSTGYVTLAQRAVIQQIRWLLVAFRRLDQRSGQRNMCPAIAAALWSSRSRISRWTIDPGHLVSRRRGEKAARTWDWAGEFCPQRQQVCEAQNNPHASSAIER